MRIRSKILVTLAAVPLGFAGVDIAVRAARLRPVPGPSDSGVITRKSDDPRIRIELIPNTSLHTVFCDRRGRPISLVDHYVNWQGFRGPEVEPQKSLGTYRVVCLGDSQTFGNGVGESAPWPAVLERELRAAQPGSAIEVLNCGVGGYETEQEVAYLENRLLAYEPDLVIIGFFLNDSALPDAPVESPKGVNSGLIRLLAPARENWLHEVRKVSRTLDLGSDWLFRHLTLRRWIVQREQIYEEHYAGWIRTRAALCVARDIVEARGGRFAILLVPLLMKEKDELVSSLPYRAVSAFCRAEGIAYYDPEPLFAGLEVDRMRVHPRDLHTDVAGHQIVGEGLARWLAEQGFDRKPAEH